MHLINALNMEHITLLKIAFIGLLILCHWQIHSLLNHVVPKPTSQMAAELL